MCTMGGGLTLVQFLIVITVIIRYILVYLFDRIFHCCWRPSHNLAVTDSYNKTFRVFELISLNPSTVLAEQ